MIGLLIHTNVLACSTDAWSVVEGEAIAAEEAVYSNKCGLVVNTNAIAYVEDHTPNNEQLYAARFYVNTYGLQGYGNVTIFKAEALFSIIYTDYNTIYAEFDNNQTNDIILEDGWNKVVVYWDSSGTITLELNDIRTETLIFPPITLGVNFVKLGIVEGDLQTLNGFIYFDSFNSTKGVDPGDDLNLCSGTNININNYTFNMFSPITCEADIISFSNVSFKSNRHYNIIATEAAMFNSISVASGTQLSILN